MLYNERFRKRRRLRVESTRVTALGVAPLARNTIDGALRTNAGTDSTSSTPAAAAESSRKLLFDEENEVPEEDADDNEDLFGYETSIAIKLASGSKSSGQRPDAEAVLIVSWEMNIKTREHKKRCRCKTVIFIFAGETNRIYKL